MVSDLAWLELQVELGHEQVLSALVIVMESVAYLAVY